MQFIRKTTMGLIASILLTLLLAFGLTFGLLRVFGTPNAIKSALKQGGAYQNAVPDAIDKIQKDQQQKGTTTGEDSLPLDKPEVRSAVESAVSPDFLETKTNLVLDAVYGWLQGKSQLQFDIGGQELRTRLANSLEQAAQQRLATLPVCTGSINTGDLDPLQATCLPKGVDAASASAQVKDKALSGDFLKDVNLGSNNIKVDNGTKTIDQKFQQGPKIYHYAVLGIYLTGLLAVLLSVALVFVSATRRAGVSKVAVTAIVAGSVVLLLGVIMRFGFPRLAELALQGKTADPLQATAVKVAQLLINDLSNWWVGYGIVLVALGIGGLLALRFLWKSPAETNDSPDAKPGKPAEEVELKDDAAGENEQYVDKLAKSSAPKPRPRPSKRLVQ